MIPQPPKFNSGDTLTADALNRAIDARLSSLLGDGRYIFVNRTMGGATIRLNIDEVKRRVGRPSWVKITSSSSVSSGIWTYTCDEYANPYDTTATATGVTARNVFEIGNVSSSMSGYTIVTSGAVCGDITGVSALPNGTFFPTFGLTAISGTTYYLIHFRNDPVIHS
jgi:hypothetical protein